MRRSWTSLACFLVLSVSSCSGSSQPETPLVTPASSASTVENPSPSPSSDLAQNTDNSDFPIEVGVFNSIDELFESGGGGCGMSLWRTEQSSQANRTLFFHGMAESKALMIFDGKVNRLSRTAASGEEFYGQQTTQTFMTEDSAIVVKVTVELGTKGEIESISIPKGLLKIETQGQTASIPVAGDAGC